MPTTRPRYVITETDDITAALSRAAEKWPEDRDSPKKLLLHLVDAGREKLREDHEQQALIERRRRLIAETSGKYTGMYPPDYLKKLREEWPE